MVEILSPIGVPAASAHRLAARLDRLSGRSVWLLSNNKNGTEALYRGLERALREYGVARIERSSKPVASVAHADLQAVAAECDAAVVALAD